MSDEPLLSVEGLHAGYGETRVLHGVSLDVEPGEVVSLIGRNGAGKTTTLRAIAGSLAPTAGRIAYDGEDVTGHSPVDVARRGIGLVPEERRVFPGLTVRENLRLGRLGGGESPHRQSVDGVLDAFDSLADRAESLGSQLSGGEQQMLAVARALVAGPRLLLLDEPTEGLAPFVVRRVEELVAELNEDGLAVLVVEQNVAVALELADRHHVVDRGEVVYEGTTADLESNREVLDRHVGVTG